MKRKAIVTAIVFGTALAAMNSREQIASAQTVGCAIPTFAPAATFDLGGSALGGPAGPPQDVTTGDFNGDGKLDIATANYDSHDVSVRLGNGSGGFSPANAFATDPFGRDYNPSSVTTGDFNGDGKLDLAAANLSWQCRGVAR